MTLHYSLNVLNRYLSHADTVAATPRYHSRATEYHLSCPSSLAFPPTFLRFTVDIRVRLSRPSHPNRQNSDLGPTRSPFFFESNLVRFGVQIAMWHFQNIYILYTCYLPMARNNSAFYAHSPPASLAQRVMKISLSRVSRVWQRLDYRSRLPYCTASGFGHPRACRDTLSGVSLCSSESAAKMSEGGTVHPHLKTDMPTAIRSAIFSSHSGASPGTATDVGSIALLAAN